MKNLRRFFGLFYKALQKWSADKASMLAAALALYTGMSLAPLLILIVALAGLFLNGEDVQRSILMQVSDAVGPSGAEIVETILESAFDPRSGIIATVISLASFSWSASSLFAQLQAALDLIWQVPPEEQSGVLSYLVVRGKALIMVISIGVLLILTVLLTTIIQAFQALLQNPAIVSRIPIISGEQYQRLIESTLPLTDAIFSIVLLSFVFAWVFRFVPHIALTWRDVMAGAIITAILFFLGKLALAIYITRGSVGSAYGAAGALLVLLVWVYYSGQILFYGAEFTYVWTHEFGSMKNNAPNGSAAQQADAERAAEPPAST